MNSYKLEKIHPKVWVFKNAFKSSKEIIDLFNNSEKENWQEWEIFGVQHTIPVYELEFDHFPSEQEWKEKEVDKTENIYIREFLQVFYDTTKMFRDEFNIEKDNWIFVSTEVAKYLERRGVSWFEAMHYHTDYEQERHLEPGIKFGLACLVYLNDDYEGGEICFKIYNDDYSAVLSEFEYKPETGDVLIFPSEHPFYHSVKSIRKGSKYLIRHWWRHRYDGHEDYWKEKNNFLLTNTEDEWEKYLEKRRAEKRAKTSALVEFGKYGIPQEDVK